MDWGLSLAVIITLLVLLPLSPLLQSTDNHDGISRYIIQLLHALALTAFVFAVCRAANIPFLVSTLVYLAMGIAGLFVGRSHKQKNPWQGMDRHSVIAAILLILFIIASIYFANERLLARRDEGLYLNYAAYLSSAKRWIVDFQLWNPLQLPLDEFAQTLDTLPGMFVMDGRAEFQAAGVYPVVLSHFYTLFGFQGAIAAGALFFAAGCYVYFDYWKKRGHALLGLFLLFALLFNLPSFWLARTTLSETLLAANAAAAIFAILRTCQTDNANSTRHHYLAILQIATLPLWKIEGSAIAALLICLLTYSLSARERALRASCYYSIVFLAIALTALSCALFYFASPLYVAYHLRFQITGLLTLLICALLTIPIRHISLVLTKVSEKNTLISTIRIAIAAAVILLAAYCLFYRPYLEQPYLVTGHPVHSINGMRDFRELSMLNLIDYLGWPVIVIGVLATAFHIIKASLRDVPMLGFCALIIIGVGSYVYAPMISPDQIWGSRRAAALCIPLTLFAASLALYPALVQHEKNRFIRTALMLTAAVVFFTPTWNSRAFWYAKENNELNKQLLQMNEQLSSSDLVITDSYVMAIALGTRFKHPTAYASTPSRLLDYTRNAHNSGKRPLIVTQQALAEDSDIHLLWRSAPITGAITKAYRAKDLQFSDQVTEEIFVYALHAKK